MKKVSLLLVFCLFVSFGLVAAAETPGVAGIPDAGELGKTKETIKDLSPINESGEFDFEKYAPYKTLAEGRIASVNKYVGWLSNVLFGVELSLSWLFVFSLFLWILLFVIVFNSVGEFFNANTIFSLVASFLISSLAMHGFGKDFVVWIDAIATTWWISLGAVVSAVIIGVVYTVFAKTFGKYLKKNREASVKMQTEKDRQVLHTDAELAKDRLNMKK